MVRNWPKVPGKTLTRDEPWALRIHHQFARIPNVPAIAFSRPRAPPIDQR